MLCEWRYGAIRLSQEPLSRKKKEEEEVVEAEAEVDCRMSAMVRFVMNE